MRTKTWVISNTIIVKTWVTIPAIISNFYKLASVLAIFTPTIKACQEVYISPAAENSLSLPIMLNILLLECIPFIYYLLHFKKAQIQVQILLKYNSEINAIILAYAASLSLKISSINVGSQKIKHFTFWTFGIALTSFKVNNKLSQSRFF